MSCKTILELLDTLKPWNKCSGFVDDEYLSHDEGASAINILECLKTKCDNIIKPENDTRSYRRIKLINDIQVLLISDPKASVSAAALDVGVGYMNDPIHLQGTAHIVQHMLYSQCDKKSMSYKFFNEIDHRNGFVNAQTTENNTTYYFAINSEFFVKALRHFSGLFQFPAFCELPAKHPMMYYLFEEDIEQIAYEYDERNTVPVDKYWNQEITTTIKCTIDENHEFTKNVCGGFKYLWNLDYDDFLVTVRNFFTEYYSSHIMTLCVYGRENLDQLEEHVKVLFSQIRNIQDPRLTWIMPKFTSVYKIWCSVPENAPSKLNYVIRIVFPLCGELTSIRNNPLTRFLSYLFEYEARGSFVTNLRHKSWAKSVEAGELVCPRGFSFFIVALELTESGYKNYFDNVMMLFIQYVQVLNKLSDSELRRIYNEYKEIMELKFRYQKIEPSLETVCNHVRHIHHVDMDQVLRCGIISQHWLQHGIKHTLQNILQPSLKLRIYLSHPSTLHKNAVLSNKYGRIPCRIKLVLPEEYSTWLNGHPQVQELNAPLPNEFIPLKVNLKPYNRDVFFLTESHLMHKKTDVPEIIGVTPFVKTWYKRDTICRVPRVTAYFHFVCPITNENYDNAKLTSWYVNILNTCLQRYKYPAGLVDLRWKLSTTVRGIMLQINGFDDTIHILLKKIVTYIMMTPGEVNFTLFLESLAQHKSGQCKVNIRDFDNLQPYEQVFHYLPYLLTERVWTPHQIWKSEIKPLWKEFRENFLLGFTESLHVECLFHGNITASEALKMSSMVENIIKNRSKFTKINPIPDEKLGLLYREVKLKKWYQCMLYRKCPNPMYSCMLVFYQIDHRSTESDVLLDLVLEALLKTAKQATDIGIVCGRHRGNVMQGLTIAFQGPTNEFRPICMNKDINKFMMYTINKMKKITISEFKELKTQVIKKHKRPETLYKMSEMYWNEILSQQYKFDRIDTELNYLKTVTITKFLQFFQSYITEKTPKLSICVIPKDLELTCSCCSSLSYTITNFDDVASYMNYQTFF
ncbi:insulin-degrading enzyme-like [Pseudomyrmex gracilis]|uniref:insulin-degrading enzyme-like n=1 Tax=Pseudomyrmex gracilis TaxID=219809 RepID=UPI0009956105|nr:insulin-degrading enzyme-like [Pseudomyrmex gracilis]